MKNKGTLVSSTIRPISTLSTYPVAYSNELMGGYQTVFSIVERNSIPFSRRELGMLVYVNGLEEFYQLRYLNSLDLSDNLNWYLVDISGYSHLDNEWINSVIDRVDIVPATYSYGDRYMVVNGSGDWYGYDNRIVEYDGVNWLSTLPKKGTSVKVDTDDSCVYFYTGGDYPSGNWIRKEFLDSQFIINDFISNNKIISTHSQYLIYGDLKVDGVVDNWGKVVILNGNIIGSGSFYNHGGGTISNINLVDGIYGGTGISINTLTYSKHISMNIVSGTGIGIEYSGNQVRLFDSSTVSYKQYTDSVTYSINSSVMLGLGTNVYLTPIKTGNIMVYVSGDVSNDYINGGSSMQIRYGIGTSPILGSTVSGLPVGGLVNSINPSSISNLTSPFSLNSIVNGLNIGTQYWFDLNINIVNGGTSSVKNISYSIFEF